MDVVIERGARKHDTATCGPEARAPNQGCALVVRHVLYAEWVPERLRQDGGGESR